MFTLTSRYLHVILIRAIIAKANANGGGQPSDRSANGGASRDSTRHDVSHLSFHSRNVFRVSCIWQWHFQFSIFAFDFDFERVHFSFSSFQRFLVPTWPRVCEKKVALHLLILVTTEYTLVGYMTRSTYNNTPIYCKVARRTRIDIRLGHEQGVNFLNLNQNIEGSPSVVLICYKVRCSGVDQLAYWRNILSKNYLALIPITNGKHLEKKEAKYPEILFRNLKNVWKRLARTICIMITLCRIQTTGRLTVWLLPFSLIHETIVKTTELCNSSVFF